MEKKEIMEKFEEKFGYMKEEDFIVNLTPQYNDFKAFLEEITK